MKKITTYFRDLKAEFSQITWPDRKTAIRLTIVVIVFSAAFAVFLGGIDYLFGEGVRKLLLY